MAPGGSAPKAVSFGLAVRRDYIRALRGHTRWFAYALIGCGKEVVI